MDIEAETDRIQAFVARGNYHAAINLAISAMNACRHVGDQVGVDRFLALIKSIVQTMEEAFGSH